MNVVWTERAENDLLQHWLFLAERSTSYAERVEVSLRSAAELIGAVPLMGRRVERTTRDLSLPSGQYVIRYRVDEDAVRILEIYSPRQKREEP